VDEVDKQWTKGKHLSIIVHYLSISSTFVHLFVQETRIPENFTEKNTIGKVNKKSFTRFDFEKEDFPCPERAAQDSLGC